MHVIKLNGYNATTENGEKLELGTFDSYGEEQLQIVKAPDWVNLSVIATFNPPNKKPVQVAVDSVTGVIKVPKEATADLYGVGTIVFVGLADGVQRISADCEYIVRKHSNASGTEPAEPTPSVVQQILTEAQSANKTSADAKKLATDAKDIAQSVRDDADNGKFNGKDGADGAKGDKGETGTTPQLKIGEDNLWQVSYDNGATWVSLGVKATGAAGKDGADGLTPYIGENGNWWVGDTDTGVSAKGAKGDTGKTPIKGADYWTEADKQEIIDDIHPAFYIDLVGNYPNYTCPVAMDDIKEAYNSGYNPVCRCAVGEYTATLPLFVPMPAQNTWIFSGAGALAAMGFSAQSMTIAIVNGTVLASNMLLASMDDIPTALPNPNALTIKIDSATITYDGSTALTVNVKDTAYTNATVNTDGLMSATDKSRADLVWNMVDASTGKLREAAIPAATDSTLGGVKVGNGLAIDSNGVLTINDEITVTTQNANLLDKSDTANQVSKNIFYVRSSSSSFVAASGDTAIYFPVGKWGAGNYKFPIEYSQYGGSTAYNIALFNADKTYIKTKTSVAVDTTDSAAYILSLNITQAEIDSGAYYIGLSIRTVQIGTSAMVVKDVDYPATYIEYGTTTSTHKTQKLENVLADKKAVFCGDSICAGKSVSASSGRYGYGWAGVIGVANNMKWQNLGVDGATVAEVFGQSGTGIVVNQLANAYSDADYIILEGGCNDYDKLSGATTADTMGEVSTSWDDSFKVTTFAGALEHLFYTALSNHPNAKVGYIIPQKMGKRTWTAYESGSYRIYYNLAIEICKKWGVPYLDLWYESSLNPNLSVYYNSSLSKDEANADGSVCYVDGQHLTEAGYDLIVPRIESWMRTL